MQWSEDNSSGFGKPSATDWREQLRGYEAQPDTGLWSQIESRLPHSSENRTAPKDLKIWQAPVLVRRAMRAAAVMALPLGLTAFWLTTGRESIPVEKNPSVVQTVPNLPAQPAEKNNEPSLFSEKKSISLPTATLLPASYIWKRSETTQNPIAGNTYLPLPEVSFISAQSASTEIRPDEFFRAGLTALEKGHYCTSHYHITMAKKMMCDNKKETHHDVEVDRMIRLVEDKLASHCFCMAEEATENCY